MNLSVNVWTLHWEKKTGIGYYETELLNALAKLDDDNKYSLRFVPNKISETVDDNSDDLFVDENHISALNRANNIKLKRFTTDKIKSSKSLYLHAFLPPFASGKNALVVYDTAVDDFPQAMRPYTRFLFKTALMLSIKKADKIITISDFSKQRIMSLYKVNEKKIEIVPCGFLEKTFHNKYPAEDIDKVLSKYKIEGEYFLFLGSLEYRKNIQRLIKAYYKFKKKHNNAPKLVVAGGKGYLYENILQLVNEHGLKDDVVFTGYVQDGDVPILMSGAMAFCFPSLYEGFGLPPLEAMACGTPVITSNTTSLPEVVGDAAITVDPKSVSEIEKALSDVFESEDLRKSLSEKGLIQCQKFSWEKSAKRLLKIIENM